MLAKDWQAAVARLAGVALLPTRWYGYEGVDLVVLSTSEPEIYQRISTSGWTRCAAGCGWGDGCCWRSARRPSEVLAPEAPLARFAPGKFAEMIPLRQTGALETFAGTSERLDRASDRGAFRLDVPKLADVRGRIDAYEGNHPRDLPLVVRSSVRIGRSDFRRLGSRSAAVCQLARRGRILSTGCWPSPSPPTTVADRRVLGHVTELGYTDLVGQLHMALSQFAGVQLVPFAAVAALVAVYIVLHRPVGLSVSEKGRRPDGVDLADVSGRSCWRSAAARTPWPIGSKEASSASTRSIWSIWMPSRAWCGGRAGRPCTALGSTRSIWLCGPIRAKSS